jgi:hypothetical protein
MVANLITLVIYHGRAVIYDGILTIEIAGTAVNYHSILITLAPGLNLINLFAVVIYHSCAQL